MGEGVGRVRADVGVRAQAKVELRLREAAGRVSKMGCRLALQ